jgi:hypothetical protein
VWPPTIPYSIDRRCSTPPKMPMSIFRALMLALWSPDKASLSTPAQVRYSMDWRKPGCGGCKPGLLSGLALIRQPAGFKQGRSPPTAAIRKQGAIVRPFAGCIAVVHRNRSIPRPPQFTLMLVSTCQQLLAAPPVDACRRLLR